MWKNSERLIAFAVLIAFFVSSHAAAQTSLSSPYSAYGIGNLSAVTNVKSRSLGGGGIGMRDNFNINYLNPASYSGFDSTSFLFEAGASGYYVTLQNNDNSESYGNGSISHLLFGFPVTKFWKTSVGALPYSMMGYDATVIDFSDEVGNTQFVFEGAGGITQAFWGNAIQLHKNLSLGLNTSYLFGTINRVQKVTFPDSINMISSISSSAITVNDLLFKFGVQYHTVLDSIKDVNLVIGATYSPQQTLGAKRNSMTRSYLGELSSVPLVIDTISMVSDELGTLVIPQNFGFGFSISRRNRWLFAADYEFGAWENYSYFGDSDSLTNSQKFRFGAEITPNPNSFSYVQRIEYRVGAHYTQSYLNLRDQQINSFGITFGAGLPLTSNMIRRTRSMLSIGFEVGRKGTMVNDLIQENYFNMFIGISIYEWWFFKRRYN